MPGKTKYAIIVNPVSGPTTAEEKRAALGPPSAVLDAEIHGLDTNSSEELRQCARELSARCDVLVAAGGDGSFSDILNAVDTAETPIAYLPLGSGNAMRYALGYRGSLADIAERIRDGSIHQYDLIDCDGKRRSFTASLGIAGDIIRSRELYLDKGVTGLKAYLMAAIDAFFTKYRPASAEIILDNTPVKVNDLLTLMVVKQPYYGFGMNVVPDARFDDGMLHVLYINASLITAAYGALSSFTIGNRAGHYHTGKEVRLTTDHPLPLQIDGNDAWDTGSIFFRILPGALKIKC
jgi:diacylglycerol kinase family enzyme